MNISIREAFLGTQQQKMYKPISRFETYTDALDSPNEWVSLVAAYPDIFKKNEYDRLFRIDGGKINWFQVYKMEIHRNAIVDLAEESNTYFYDTETQSIVFNNDEPARSTEAMTELFPLIAEFIDSGSSQGKLS